MAQSGYRPKDAFRTRGLLLVLALHVLLGWLLISLNVRKGPESLSQPLAALLIQEVTLAPPPPAPPPPAKPIRPVPATPRVAPPPFVPPPLQPAPELAAPPTAGLSIAATATPPSAAPVLPALPPAAPVPAAAPKAPAKSDIGLACPTQVPPEMPRKAIQEGIEGVVRAQALIQHGKVTAVTIISGPRVFHTAVRNAMRQYVCTERADEVLATQEFNFRLE